MAHKDGDVAQLGERRLCKAEVTGSSPVISTTGKPERSGFGLVQHLNNRIMGKKGRSAEMRYVEKAQIEEEGKKMRRQSSSPYQERS